MREILFRGKHAISGEWIYGDLLCSNGNYYIHEKGKPIVSYVPPMAAFGTVGEWTGLTDKDGRKIFEGDIVRGKDCIGGRREGSVFYDNYNAMYMIKPNTKSEYREVNCLTSLTPADIYLEVIGNKYDNPELLEVKDELEI